ncbi:MAG: HlyD family secretion protein [Burkholderiaceae bacterium]
MLEDQPEDIEEGARQSAFRTGYRTGFADGFDAADKVHEASRRKAGKEGGEDKDGDGKPGGKQDDGPGKDDPSRDGGKEGEKDKDKDKPKGPPLWKRPGVVLVIIVVAIAAIVGVTLFVIHSRSHETTDDAFIDGNASQIAAQAAGRVTALHVNDNQEVKAGDPLLDIDTADVQAKVDQAKAQVLSAQGQESQARAQVETQKASAAQASAQVLAAQAEATNAHQDLARFKGVDPDAVSRQQYDQAAAQARSADAKLAAARATERAALAQVRTAQANVEVAAAQVATAQAALEAADIQLGYTHVRAPIAGRVAKRSVDVGNVVAIGQPLLAIVSDDLWVTANYKETQLKKMRLHQPVTIEVDAVPGVKFAGHVDSLQRATGAYFSMLPSENATGNYVKVTQRVPVKIVFDHPEDLKRYPIGPGMSVKPSVDLDAR